jgi:hypothetical protein
MRKVLDPSFFQDPALQRYLAADHRNKVVLPDYAAMESYKADDPVRGAANFVAILGRYPNQVEIPKGTRRLVTSSWRGRGLQRRWIDEAQTRDFAKFCEQVTRAAAVGDTRVARASANLQAEAVKHFEQMLHAVHDLSDALTGIRETFTPAELKALRRGDAYTPELLDKIVWQVIFLSARLTGDHPDRPRFPRELDHALNTYAFRHALCAFLMALDRIERGAIENVKPAKARNDIVDMHYVTCATFFDGLLTNDRRMRDRYTQAMVFLRYVFRHPPLLHGAR